MTLARSGFKFRQSHTRFVRVKVALGHGKVAKCMWARQSGQMKSDVKNISHTYAMASQTNLLYRHVYLTRDMKFNLKKNHTDSPGQPPT